MSRHPHPAPAFELERPKSWTDDAACTPADARLFYPLALDELAPRDRSSLWKINAENELEAKAISHRCPVRRECRRDAIEDTSEWGVRGGLNAAERRYRVRQEKAA